MEKLRRPIRLEKKEQEVNIREVQEEKFQFGISATRGNTTNINKVEPKSSKKDSSRITGCNCNK